MATPIKLIVGLGNPGPDYAGTRHNAGEWFVSAIANDCGTSLRFETKFHGLAARATVAGASVHLLFPSTFMNHSGQAVSALSQFYKITPQEILIAHDELDLPCGEMRLKFDGGHGGHNGLRDIMSHLGSKEFYRLRIGIGHPGHSQQVLNYVLGHPSAAQRQAVDDGFCRVMHLLPDIIKGDMPRAMKQLHTTES